jgi:tRNA dimethylallyltransferase
MDKTIHIIAGPTASGKSALAVTRAQDLNGVIINADSRQIYDALPLLTAQPSADDFKTAPHALYGHLHPNDACSAGLWCLLARTEIERCFANDLTPIITGGNGLYIKALIEGLSPIPLVPDDVRCAAVEKQAAMGNPAFYEELKRIDPLTASLYHPMHTARLVHAYEVFIATGKPLAQWQAHPKNEPPADWRFDITLVMPPRDVLYNRCNMRFEQMMEMGAEEELMAFDAQVSAGEVSTDSILIKTIGASPLRDLRGGVISRAKAITLAQTETRQYAKRQVTWFTNQIKERRNIVSIKQI